MRLLVITTESGWVEALRALFPAVDDIIPVDARQVVHNPALLGAVDACFIAEATTSPWTVETLKQINTVTEAPLFVLADPHRSQWEEAALFAGANQIFRRPLRAGVIQLAISRVQRRRLSEPPGAVPAAGAGTTSSGNAPGAVEALALWRDFSRLLGHPAPSPAFLADYLTKLREVLRCARLILYLPDEALPEMAFRCACASGADEREFAAFRLNLRSGLGLLLRDRGTIVSRLRLRPDSARDAAALRELVVLGADVAVPLAGRDGLAGLLLVGPRISGGEYSDQELSLLYHTVEALGATLREQKMTPPGPTADEWPTPVVLAALPIASAIVSGTRLVAANAAFRALLGRMEATALQFEDLPTTWSAPITAVVLNRVASARVELDHQMIGAPRKVRLAVHRLESPADAASAVLVTVEDAAPATVAQEADAHDIHILLQRAGEQLSNEFRNALTPVDIMVQLSRDPSTTRSELERLGTQVGSAIHRLRRRVDDLAYLTKSAIIPEPTTVSAVLRLTRERLDDWLEGKQLKRIVWLNEFSEAALTVDTRAVALALAELVMNGIEASDGHQVTITAEDLADSVSFRVRNFGVWTPPPESSGFRHRPFVSNKSTGVGLGIEVASRVAENHGGKLLLGPISAEIVEAIMRLSRTVALSEKVEMRIARTF
jgi:nitrogen-specific signal transduction histidine kinase